MYIYVLQLKNDKYYVGKTDNLDSRFAQHFSGKAAAWTKKHRPIEVVEIIPDADEFDEDKYTKIYMREYGVENVRGGSFCQFALPDFQIESLKVELHASDDVCFLCNHAGHYVSECPTNKSKNKKQKTKKIYKRKKNKKIVCYKCGIEGHYATKCNTNTDTVAP
tara:strand:- start:370 stop:861 length:492 start_codon:yes stop_codon:yes gene_type:complete